jgi:hypothetical protein
LRAPKTPLERTMRLTNGNVEVLKPAIELKAKPQESLFKNG